MADIFGHPWMNGPIATEDQIRQEFRSRVKTIGTEASENIEQKIAMQKQAHAKA